MALFVFGSCQDFLDINDDPKQAQDVPANLSIPAAIGQVAGSLSGEYSIFGGMWSQHWAQNNSSSQYKSEDSYAVKSADYNNEWTLLYSDALIDLKLAKDKSEAEEDWNVHLQAEAVTAFTYQILVDLYDQIPYTEALETSNFNPRFDDGATIYTDLIARLDDATNKDFSASTNTFNPNDFLFGLESSPADQAQRWVEFTNTLKLKLYLRQLEARPAVASDGIRDMINEGTVFLSQDAAITAFEDAASKRFPLYENDREQLNTDNNIKVSNTLAFYLETNNDPRIADFVEPNDVGNFSGIINGSYDIPTATLSPQSISRAVVLPTQPFLFFSEEEVYFMLAEAYARVMNDLSTAKLMYDAGVTAAFNRYGHDASNHIASGGAYEFPSSGDLIEDILKAIITQKWVAYVYRGYESFLEQNRTGFPKVSTISTHPCNITYLPGDCDPSYVPGEYIISLESTLGGDILPRRLVFPDDEVNVNTNAPAKVPTEVPVWWDVK